MNYNNQNKIMVMIENEKIYQLNYNGQPLEIGVTTKAYTDIQEELNSAIEEVFQKAETIQKERDEYKELLIQNGIIQKEKTQEEMHNETMEMMKSLHNSFLSLKSDVDNLKSSLGE